MPLLARLYGPANFGQFSVMLAVIVVTATVITLRYETTILLPKSIGLSSVLTQLSLALTFILGSVLFCVALLLPDSVTRRIGVDVLARWFAPTVLLSIVAAANAVATNVWSKQGRYVELASLKLAQSMIAAVVAVFLGLVGISSGLLWAQVISMIAIGIVLLVVVRKVRPLKFKRIVTVAYIYRDTPKYLFPTALLDVVTLQMPVILIAAWYGGELAGQFGMAWRLMTLPVSFAGIAVGQVFFQRFSSIWPRAEDAKTLLLNTWKALIAIGIAPTLLIMCFGPQIFSWLLGAAWSRAGEVAAVMSPMIFCMFVSSPTSMAFVVMGLQRYSLFFGIAFMMYRTICIYIGYRQNNLILGLALWVCCELIAIFYFNKIIIDRLKRCAVD